MKIRNWEMLRNEWTLEGLACNAGKTAISMRSLMSGIFSCNPYQFLDTTLWEHVRNVSVDFRNMSHMSMICKQQQQQLPWLHSQGCEWIVVASDTPKIESLVFGYVSWPRCRGAVRVLEEDHTGTRPSQGLVRSSRHHVTTERQIRWRRLQQRCDTKSEHSAVRKDLGAHQWPPNHWCVRCQPSEWHPPGQELKQHAVVGANHQSGQQSHPTSSAICRNLAKSMTRGYAEAPHKIMAGRKTKAVFPQNDEPIRIVFRNIQVGSKHENRKK